MCCMRLIPNLKLYEPHRPSCMNLIHCMRTKLIQEVCMSLIQNVCGVCDGGGRERARAEVETVTALAEVETVTARAEVEADWL